MRLPPAVLIVSTLLSATALAAQTSLKDIDVSDAVEREFIYDHAVPSNHLDVSTVDGVVALEGTVPNILAKDRAVRIAETVKGVRAVVDLMEVKPPKQRNDADIKADVEQALLKDPATDSYEISVSVEDGTATLTGTVESWDERRLAEYVTKGVKGVTGLTNNISVEYQTERPDHEIKQDIVQSMRWNYLLDHALINVEVENGAVTLSGTVGSAAEKRQARYDAWTGGVKSLNDSDLMVALWARDEELREEKYVSRTDDEIQKAVKAAFLHDPRVFSFDVDTSVSAGIVTLRGVVDNLKAKRAAEDDAANTVGVISVKNYLKVRPTVDREDSAIAKDIRDALLRDPYVERFETTVSVYAGTAYLSGTVDSYFEKSRADEIASRVTGVVDVVNNITVDYDPVYTYDPWVDPWGPYDYDWYEYTPTYTYTSDWKIKESIEDELFWSPFVDEDEVTVTVDDGVATLTGTVQSAMEKGAAADNAYEGGATYVRNKLEVSS